MVKVIINILAKIGWPVYLLLKFFWRLGKTVVSKSKILIGRFLRRVQKFRPRLVRPTIKKFPRKLIAVLLLIILAAAGFYWSILKDLPRPEKLSSRPIQQSTKIYDRHGQLLYKIYRQKNRTLISLEQVPLHAQQATIAIEDNHFWNHHGLSFSGIARATWRIITRKKLEGGSTITQQLVKNALLSPKRTLKRKVKEVILAVLVENRFTKKEILQMYFNEVGYGGAAYGIEEASQHYFGKPAAQLNPAESALLAGLPASPTTYSPFGPHPHLAKKRQKEVLNQMVKKDYLNLTEKQHLEQAPLKFASRQQNIKAPHFVMYIKEKLVDKFGIRYVEEGGLEVTTTLDLNLQQLAAQTVKKEIDNLARLRVTNGAALITRPQTGEILTMIGSTDYFDQTEQGNFNVTTARRQPGSTIKVVNYALALQNGYTLATIVPDTPITFKQAGQPPYRPQNYDNRFHGNVTLREALASSYNVPAVKILASLGVDNMTQMGQKMGINSWTDPQRFGLSLTLGGGEVKMTELATVYGTLANQGKKVPLQAIKTVKNHQGKVIWQNSCLKESPTKEKNCQTPVLNPGIAYLLTDVLADNRARTPAFGPNSLLHIPDHAVAVKTGTSNNLRDNWTIGYTPNFLVATWVGNNDNSTMSQVASGITGASPIWRQLTDRLLTDYPNPDFIPPDNVVRQTVCLQEENGECQRQKGEYFLKDTGFSRTLTRTPERLLPARKDSRQSDKN